MQPYFVQTHSGFRGGRLVGAFSLGLAISLLFFFNIGKGNSASYKTTPSSSTFSSREFESLSTQKNIHMTVGTFNVSNGKRAISIEVSASASVEGHAQPGSTVDVVGTYVDEDGIMRSILVAQDVKVLAYGGEVQSATRDPKHFAPELHSTITLESTPEEALHILNMREMGVLSLILKNSAVLNERRSLALKLLNIVLPPPPVIYKNKIIETIISSNTRYCRKVPGTSAKFGTVLEVGPDNIYGLGAYINNCFGEPAPEGEAYYNEFSEELPLHFF